MAEKETVMNNQYYDEGMTISVGSNDSLYASKLSTPIEIGINKGAAKVSVVSSGLFTPMGISASNKRPNWKEYFLGIAKAASERSTCNRRKVGAIIVKDNRILSTGYNGSPPNQDHCVDVGCEMGKEVFQCCDDVSCQKCGGENVYVIYHCMRTIHAELNSIAWAARYGVGVDNADMYVWYTGDTSYGVCRRCEAAMMASGIRRYIDPYIERQISVVLISHSGMKINSLAAI